MSVGVLLHGIVSAGTEPQPDLGRIQRWLRAQCGETLVSAREAEDSGGRSALYVLLHPAAEEVEFIRSAPGALAVSANTSTAGPGYHMYLCDLLERLGADLDVAWQTAEGQTADETGYFHRRDPGQVYKAMLAWLKRIAQILAADLSVGDGQLLVCMPSNHHFDDRWRVVSPLGPLNPEWIERIAEEPQRGESFFPWWNAAQDADYSLRRALSLMWKDVRWRLPLSDSEAAAMGDAAAMLERAYTLDPGRQYPWREWKELIGYGKLATPLEGEIIARAEGVDPATPLIGYRRQSVRVDLTGGWSIRIPGAFAESREDERTWYAWDSTRTVRFSCFSITNEDGTPQTAEEILGAYVDIQETFDHEEEGVVGRAYLAHSLDEHWNLHGRSAVSGSLAVCTITIGSPEDKKWALETWRSLRYGQ
jgi:hypothetical protein